jgi:CheY-like chemotaxis protein
MSSASSPTRRVLLVEDEPSIRHVLVEALRWEGYQVTPADNGLEALALLHGSLPHVIVLDLMLPVMDGFVFRAHPLRTARLVPIPVIVISARYRLNQAMPPLRAHACLSKPLDLDLLLDTVAAATEAAA